MMASAAADSGVVILASGDACLVSTSRDTVRCTLRGRLRKDAEKVITGDRVRISRLDDGSGIVEEIMPRHSQLSRPPVANVDHVVVMATLVDPPLNVSLLDRLLVLVEYQDLDATVCINKIDLASASDVTGLAERYERAGYVVVAASATTGAGTCQLLARLTARISVLAGETGTGKSSMLNRLVPGAELEEGEVDARIRRGKHTTRFVRLLELPGGGLVADSPGFMRVSLAGIAARDLADCFPELRRLLGSCQFADCVHADEPGCAVKEAVETGSIARERYNSYLTFVSEARDWEEGLYR